MAKFFGEKLKIIIRTVLIIVLGAVLFFVAGFNFFDKKLEGAELKEAAPIEKGYANNDSLRKLIAFNLISNQDANIVRLKETDQVKISFEGEDIILGLPVYVDANRYYFPLEKMVSCFGGSIKSSGAKRTINLGNTVVEIDIDGHFYVKNGNGCRLRNDIVSLEGNSYISLFDFVKMFDLVTDWQEDQKEIALYFNRDKAIIPRDTAAGKPALIRLEDITAGWVYQKTEALAKLRVFGDYLYSNDIPFSIAWIPRYIDPRKSPAVDNDISKNNSFINCDFVFTMDYLIDRNGILGLHGYTHQYGKGISYLSSEFHILPNDGIPDTEEYIQSRIDKAKDSANRLNFPYVFFESPHYAIGKNHLEILDQNFDVLYQGNSSKVIIKKTEQGNKWYVGAYLDFVTGVGANDVNNMLTKLSQLDPESLASFFYHPYFEFDYISIVRDEKGYPAYKYEANSPMHLLAKGFLDKGYKFVPLYEVLK